MDSLVNTASTLYIVEEGVGSTQTLLSNFNQEVTDVAVTPDGTLFILTFGSLFRVELVPNTSVEEIANFNGLYANGLTSDDQGLLYIGFNQDARIEVIDPETETSVRTINLASGARSGGDMHIIEDRLYFSTSDNEIVTINLSTGNEVRTLGIDLTEIVFGLSAIDTQAAAQIIDVPIGNGLLLAYAGASAYQLNPATGQARFLSELDVNGEINGSELLAEYYYQNGTNRPETVNGSFFDDWISGRGGADSLFGSEGNDVLDGGPNGDTINGGDGIDIVSYESARTSVRVDLQNDEFMYGDAVGDTFIDVEIFRTGNTVDQLRGDANSNTFYTGGLSDRLYGRAGDDFLYGEDGADAFYGGLGADTMTAGYQAGRTDRFIYFSIAESGVGDGNRDVITDYVAGEDRIEISRFDADVGTGGRQDFVFVGAAEFSGNAGELRFEAEASYTLVQADVDGDSVADFEIELAGMLTLTEIDFLL